MTLRCVLLSAVLLVACGSGSEPVELAFRAWVGARPFSCREQYDGVGADESRVSFSDLRMYVSALTWIGADGERQPIELVPDGLHQDARTALVDFEDKTGSCTVGTRETHLRVRGRAPRGRHRALELDVGVPFADNHQDASVAKAPFDVTSMFWVWRDGYKFLRLDGQSHEGAERHGFSVHLGSTGCTGGGGAPTDKPRACSHPNRAHLRFEGFDPTQHTIDLHVDALLAGLTLHGPSARDGCESSPDDPDCAPVLAALGLAATPAPRGPALRMGTKAP